MKAEIIRQDFDQGTFGTLKLKGRLFCWTLEREDLGNVPNISCIPTGDYECKRHVSHRFGETFEVCNVQGRTDILFHAGNYVDETKGCILLGRRIGEISGQRAVLESRKAFDAFMKRLEGVFTFELSIRKC